MLKKSCTHLHKQMQVKTEILIKLLDSSLCLVTFVNRHVVGLSWKYV